MRAVLEARRVQDEHEIARGAVPANGAEVAVACAREAAAALWWPGVANQASAARLLAAHSPAPLTRLPKGLAAVGDDHVLLPSRRRRRHHAAKLSKADSAKRKHLGARPVAARQARRLRVGAMRGRLVGEVAAQAQAAAAGCPTACLRACARVTPSCRTRSRGRQQSSISSWNLRGQVWGAAGAAGAAGQGQQAGGSMRASSAPAARRRPPPPAASKLTTSTAPSRCGAGRWPAC